MVRQELLDSFVLVRRSFEDVAESATGENNLLAGTLRLEHGRVRIDLSRTD